MMIYGKIDNRLYNKADFLKHVPAFKIVCSSCLNFYSLSDHEILKLVKVGVEVYSYIDGIEKKCDVYKYVNLSKHHNMKFLSLKEAEKWLKYYIDYSKQLGIHMSVLNGCPSIFFNDKQIYKYNEEGRQYE